MCTGDSAFVEFESMFIHYSEVSVNGLVLVRVHIAFSLQVHVRVTHALKSINAAQILSCSQTGEEEIHPFKVHNFLESFGVSQDLESSATRADL